MNNQAYDKLAIYSLSHPSPDFIHQHLADAYTLYTADENTKPISILFALAGIYLFTEKNYTGKKVQQVHLQMSARKQNWPLLSLPVKRSTITPEDLLRKKPGSERDQLLFDWCRDIWHYCSFLKDQLEQVLSRMEIL